MTSRSLQNASKSRVDLCTRRVCTVVVLLCDASHHCSIPLVPVSPARKDCCGTFETNILRASNFEPSDVRIDYEGPYVVTVLPK